MQFALPAEGSLVWIRRHRWRVERARRDDAIVRLDVAGRGGRLTFLAPFDRPCPTAGSGAPRRVRPQAVIARLAGLLGRASTYRGVASLVDAKVQILPYQIEPAMAILRGARRVLIADAVGLGKTIQAGLAIAELQRRDPGLRVLVIVPSSLRAQWSDELRERFGMDARRGDAASIAQLSRAAARTGHVWHRSGVWLSAIDYVKQPHVLGELCRRSWDLLVIDEAHGVCGETERHHAAAELARRSSRVLLLSATPHSGDEASFERLLELGTLPTEVEEPTVFRRTRQVLGPRPARRVRWHAVRLSANETRLFGVLSDFERAVLHASGGRSDHVALLLLSVFRKRALSTTGAFLVSIERRLAWIESQRNGARDTWQQPRLIFEGDEDATTRDECEALTGEIGLRSDLEGSWLRRLREIGRSAARDESKARYLASLLGRTKEPVAVFTEFRDSLAILQRRIEADRATSRAPRTVAVLHGGLTPEEQQQQLERFLNGSASVLLATDVASQGLNLQARCRWILNLELPWNPVRIEQRAGRVDRLGQHRPVHVGLLVSSDKAESEVLARLVRRTLSAQQSLGADVLALTAPDESSVRSYLIGGSPLGVFGAAAPLEVPLAPAHPPRRVVSLCRRWSRLASREAGHLAKRRQLARCWRADVQPGRCCVTRLDHLPVLWRLARGGALLCFSVPLVDGWGATLERRIVLVRVPNAGIATARDCERAHASEPARTERGAGAPASERVGGSAGAKPPGLMLDEIRQWLARRLQTRARRLQRLRRAETTRAAHCERAMAAVLRRSADVHELQPGLFDRRALRTGDCAAIAMSELEADLDARVRALEAGSVVTVGVPILVLAVTPKSTL